MSLEIKNIQYYLGVFFSEQKRTKKQLQDALKFALDLEIRRSEIIQDNLGENRVSFREDIAGFIESVKKRFLGCKSQLNIEPSFSEAPDSLRSYETDLFALKSAIYLGNLIIENNPGIRWDIITSKREEGYQTPALADFSRYSNGPVVFKAIVHKVHRFVHVACATEDSSLFTIESDLIMRWMIATAHLATGGEAVMPYDFYESYEPF